MIAWLAVAVFVLIILPLILSYAVASRDRQRRSPSLDDETREILNEWGEG